MRCVTPLVGSGALGALSGTQVIRATTTTWAFWVSCLLCLLACFSQMLLCYYAFFGELLLLNLACVTGRPIVQCTDLIEGRLQQWSFFSNDAMEKFFFRAPLPTMVFQRFCYSLTINIECFFADWPLTSMVFQWFYPNSCTMVSNGFGYERT